MNETLQGIRGLAAITIVLVVGMIVLVMDAGKEDNARRRVLPFISLFGLALAGLVAYISSINVPTLSPDVEPNAVYFGGGMIADSFGGLFSFVLCLVAGLAIAMSGQYLEEKHLNAGEYYALILFSTSGAMMMAHAFDLVNVFIGLEVLSVSLYILSGFAKRERRSEESAVKYFLLGAFASGFLLYGTALVYGAVGLAAQERGLAITGTSYTNFYAIGEVLRASAQAGTPLVSSPLFVTGVALILVSLGFKASIVPFHSYAPDVYEGAPTPVTAFMSAGAKIGAFAALARLFTVLLTGTEAGPFRLVLWVLAAATMIVGNVLAVRQTNIKRMLAYSSIAHAGYILVGVLATGYDVSSIAARQAILFYLFVYTFMNLGAFAVVIWLGRGGGEYLNISDYAGLGKRQPAAAAALSVFLLSLAGIPLTAGFLGKLYLFFAAIKAGEIGLATLGLVVSAIGVFYYLNVVVQMYFREPVHDFDAPREGGARTAAVFCAVATVVFGILPNPLLPREGLDANVRAPRPLTPPRSFAPAGSALVLPNQRSPRTEPTPATEPTPGPTASPTEGVPASPAGTETPGSSEPTPDASPAALPTDVPASPEGGALTPEAQETPVPPGPAARATASPPSGPSPTPAASPQAEPTP